MSENTLTLKSGDIITAYTRKAKVVNMQTTSQFGSYNGVLLIDALGSMNPTQYKIYCYILKNVDHNHNFVRFSAETFNLNRQNFYKNFKKFKDAQFARKVGVDDIPNMIVKKNSYIINPYFLLPKYGRRAIVADIWNLLIGHPTHYADEPSME